MWFCCVVFACLLCWLHTCMYVFVRMFVFIFILLPFVVVERRPECHWVTLHDLVDFASVDEYVIAEWLVRGRQPHAMWSTSHLRQQKQQQE
eukprot:m.229600 g.229600  ORF g.229600 m.229600 type:complete len:91 (+) comp13885_c1_seq1:6881-7153(+)